METRKVLPSEIFRSIHVYRPGPIEVVRVPIRDTEGTGALSGRLDAFTSFYIDNGMDILCHLELILDKLTGSVAPNLTEALRWKYHRRELYRLLGEFLLPAADLPTVIWNYSACWTDRCKTKFDTGDSLGLKNLGLSEYRGAPRVRLRFRPPEIPPRGGLFRWPKNYITVRADKLLWEYPDGMSMKAQRFVRYRADENVLRDNRFKLSSGYRERLGPAANSVEHEPWINKGVYPSLVMGRKICGLWIGPDGHELMLRWTKPEVEASEPPEPGYRLVDGTGIWDAQLIKLQRIFRNPDSSDTEDLLFDELSLLFDRNTSRLVCIGVLHDELAYDREAFGRSMLGIWLACGAKRNGDFHG